MNVNQEPLVSVIIVNFNGKDLLSNCLRSVFMTDYPHFEVIVVDNGSTDDSCAMVKKVFPNVQLVETKVNLGYSRGNNLGILRSKGEFVVLLNNDTSVSPRWLSALIQEADRNPECFYQPKILFEQTKRINSAGNCIQLLGFAFPRGIGDADSGQYEERREISYASGACVLASKHLIHKVGLLDEDDLFTFYEDVNWGWRGLMIGYKSVYVPSSVIYHKWGGSWGSNMSSKKFFLIERARLATLFKNYSVETLIYLLPGILLIEMFVFLYSFKNGFVSKKIMTYSDLIKAKNVIAEQRRELSKIRKNSDGTVVKYFTDELIHPYFGALGVPVNRVLSFLSRNLRLFIR